jgi:hypothetical protein
MRRVIITSENRTGRAPWLTGSYDLMQETPYTFASISQFNCQPNRGAAASPMLLVNHWLRSPGPPDPVASQEINSSAVLTKRLEQCIQQRGRLPNVLATDFTSIGDTVAVCDEFNGAIARITGATTSLDLSIEQLRDDPAATTEDIAELDNLVRLPDVSMADATKMLGAVGQELKATESPHGDTGAS